MVQRVGRGIALLFHDRGTRRGWLVSSTPRPHFTPGKTRYPFYRRLGGPQGRSGLAENLVPNGIRSRTVQPVAQPLYRLSYRAHICVLLGNVKYKNEKTTERLDLLMYFNKIMCFLFCFGSTSLLQTLFRVKHTVDILPSLPNTAAL